MEETIPIIKLLSKEKLNQGINVSHLVISENLTLKSFQNALVRRDENFHDLMVYLGPEGQTSSPVRLITQVMNIENETPSSVFPDVIQTVNRIDEQYKTLGIQVYGVGTVDGFEDIITTLPQSKLDFYIAGGNELLAERDGKRVVTNDVKTGLTVYTKSGSDRDLIRLSPDNIIAY